MDTKRDQLVDDFVKFALVALLIVLPIRAFVAQPFVVRGESMEPTFKDGDYLIVDQLSYRLGAPRRGDVIIMRYPKDQSLFFIKRIIGLPGETVELEGSNVVVDRPNAAPITLDEPYVEAGHLENEYGSYTLGPTDYFVKGDNRIASTESRPWGVLPRAIRVAGHDHAKVHMVMALR